MAFINKVLSLFILRNKWATTFVIAAMIFLSAAVLWGLHSNLDSVEENRLQTEMTRVKSLIQDRIDSHINSLNAVRGLLSLDGEPTPKQFQLFVSVMQASQQKTSTFSIGYAKYFPSADTPIVEHVMHSIGRYNFNVWPKSKEKWRSSILLIEPLTERNIPTLGFDMLSEPSRREAMQNSVETGKATLSIPLRPILVPKDDYYGITLYVPYFGKGTAVPSNAQDRKRFLKGFLYAPIRIDDFFQQIFSSPTYLSDKINFSLEAIVPHQKPIHLYTRFPDKPIAQNRSEILNKEEIFQIKNQKWVLKMTPVEKLLSSSEEMLVWTAWASIFILIAIVLYIIKKTQLFIIEEERRKKLLQEASLAKSNFLANMSHEIRTPLGAIVGFTDIICRENIPKSDKENYVAQIGKNVQLLTRIIDDVLDHSRIEAGKLPIEKRKLSLPRLLFEIESVMSLQAKKKEFVKLQVLSRGLIPEKIITDEMRLKQILMNLIGNALKFTNHGNVSLTVQCPVDAQTNKRYLEFLIDDSGIGIPLEVQSELFEGFVQADASTTRRYGGTGLGLALSKKIARLLGGDSELVRSSPGRGSLFRVHLPIEDISDQHWLTDWKEIPELLETPLDLNLAQESNHKELLKNKNILLVEDSEDNQDIFKLFLESVGAKIDIIDNGIDAVQLIKTKSYDLVLMDIQIPGIDGKEATRRMRLAGFTNPIIALTAHAMPGEIESCIQSGCNGQITKPVTGEQLIKETEAFL